MFLEILNWFASALSRLSSRIPFLQSLTYFSWPSHKSAISKFLMLWILTSLPVVVAAMLSPVPLNSPNVAFDLYRKLREAISVSEQFVYTATYLSPVLYILWERYQFHLTQSEGAEELGKVFRGYGWVAALSLITIILTATAFSSIKTNIPFFQKTFLYEILVSNAGYIYLFSLYCFYLSILDGNFNGDYVLTSRKSEDKTASQFKDRLKNRNRSNP